MEFAGFERKWLCRSKGVRSEKNLHGTSAFTGFYPANLGCFTTISPRICVIHHDFTTICVRLSAFHHAFGTVHQRFHHVWGHCGVVGGRFGTDFGCFSLVCIDKCVYTTVATVTALT